jgi:hypothetical protein
VTQTGWTDPEIGWTMPKSARIDSHGGDGGATFTTNSQGFRGTSEFDVRDSEARIAFLGDSFTFGFGVADAETFAARLERALPGVRAFNFGVTGFGLDQMWLALRARALPAKPDLVVVSFVIDDLNRCLTAYRDRGGWSQKPTFVLRGGELVLLTRDMRPPAWRRWLEQDSRVFELWRRIQNAWSLSKPIGARWKLARAIFAAMRDDCARASVPLVVMHIPERGHWAPVATFASEFDELGIAFLDLGATHPSSPDELYLAKDPHFNAKGHEYACGELLRFLGARGELARIAKLVSERAQ